MNTDTFNLKFNWILREELAIGIAPEKEKHLFILKEKGISSILNLCHK